MARASAKHPKPPVELAETTLDAKPAVSEDGVDLTLIRWMLELTPTERLQAAQDMIDTAWTLREDREA